MKPKRDIAPYLASADMSVNASISLGKIYKRMRTIDPARKPCSRYRARLLSKRAERRFSLGTKRP